MLGSKLSSGGNWELRVIAPLPLTELFLGVEVDQPRSSGLGLVCVTQDTAACAGST